MRSTHLVFRAPPPLKEWLDAELEKRGIDSVYTRYILSILQEENDDMELDENIDMKTKYIKTFHKYDLPEAVYSANKLKRQKCRAYKKQILLSGNDKFSEKRVSDLERRKKNTAVNCLKSLSDDNTIESLIEEVTIKLKNWKNVNENENSRNHTVKEDVPFYMSPSSPTEEFEKYLAAFPALTSNAKNNNLVEITNLNAWNNINKMRQKLPRKNSNSSLHNEVNVPDNIDTMRSSEMFKSACNSNSGNDEPYIYESPILDNEVKNKSSCIKIDGNLLNNNLRNMSVKNNFEDLPNKDKISTNSENNRFWKNIQYAVQMKLAMQVTENNGKENLTEIKEFDNFKVGCTKMANKTILEKDNIKKNPLVNSHNNKKKMNKRKVKENIPVVKCNVADRLQSKKLPLTMNTNTDIPNSENNNLNVHFSFANVNSTIPDFSKYEENDQVQHRDEKFNSIEMEEPLECKGGDLCKQPDIYFSSVSMKSIKAQNINSYFKTAIQLTDIKNITQNLEVTKKEASDENTDPKTNDENVVFLFYNDNIFELNSFVPNIYACTECLSTLFHFNQNSIKFPDYKISPVHNCLRINKLANKDNALLQCKDSDFDIKVLFAAGRYIYVLKLNSSIINNYLEFNKYNSSSLKSEGLLFENIFSSLKNSDYNVKDSFHSKIILSMKLPMHVQTDMTNAHTIFCIFSTNLDKYVFDLNMVFAFKTSDSNIYSDVEMDTANNIFKTFINLLPLPKFDLFNYYNCLENTSEDFNVNMSLMTKTVEYEYFDIEIVSFLREKILKSLLDKSNRFANAFVVNKLKIQNNHLPVLKHKNKINLDIIFLDGLKLIKIGDHLFYGFHIKNALDFYSGNEIFSLFVNGNQEEIFSFLKRFSDKFVIDTSSIIEHIHDNCLQSCCISRDKISENSQIHVTKDILTFHPSKDISFHIDSKGTDEMQVLKHSKDLFEQGLLNNCFRDKAPSSIFKPALEYYESQEKNTATMQYSTSCKPLIGKDRNINCFYSLSNQFEFDKVKHNAFLKGQKIKDDECYPLFSSSLTQNYFDLDISLINEKKNVIYFWENEYQRIMNEFSAYIWTKNIDDLKLIWEKTDDSKRTLHYKTFNDINFDSKTVCEALFKELKEEEENIFNDLHCMLNLDDDSFEKKEFYSNNLTHSNDIKLSMVSNDENLFSPESVRYDHLHNQYESEISSYNTTSDLNVLVPPYSINADDCQNNSFDSLINCADSNISLSFIDESYETDYSDLSAFQNSFENFCYDENYIEGGGWSLVSESLSEFESDIFPESTYSFEELDTCTTGNTELGYLEDESHNFSEVGHFFPVRDENINFKAKRLYKQKYQSSMRPCVYYMEGKCQRLDCRYSHDLSKIPCRFWKEGSCFKGMSCPFLHGFLSEIHSPSYEYSPVKQAKKEIYSLDSEVDFPSLSSEKNDMSEIKSLPVDIIHVKGRKKCK